MPPRFIVGEISKNWDSRADGVFLSAKFEEMIEHNLARGYTLHSFQVNRVLVPARDPRLRDGINETIIAVFELTLVELGR